MILAKLSSFSLSIYLFSDSFFTIFFFFFFKFF
jgi:hypothetical protein